MSVHSPASGTRTRNPGALDGPNKARPSVSRASLRRVLATIIWPRRWLLLLGLLLIGINKLAGLVIPWSSKVLIDDVIGAGNTSLLPLLLVAVGGAVLMQSASSFLQTRLLSVQAQHLIATLRGRVQRHLIRLPVAFFDDNQTGALVSRVMRDVEGVRNLIGTGLGHLVGGALTAVVVMILMLRISVPMTLFTLGADRSVRRAGGPGVQGDPSDLSRARRHQRGGHRTAHRVIERHPRDQGLPRRNA